jgi:hypothetical protein
MEYGVSLVVNSGISPTPKAVHLYNIRKKRKGSVSDSLSKQNSDLRDSGVSFTSSKSCTCTPQTRKQPRFPNS